MPGTILFHCGSAKTASTTIQNELWARREALKKAGYHYCPRFVRAGNVDPVNVAIRDIRWGDRATAVEAGRSRLAGLFEGGYHTVIISNESALGDPFHDSRGGFFPHLTRSLEGIEALFEGYEVKAFFTVRNQADLLPSFYTQRVRQGAGYRDAIYYEQLMADGLSWVPIIQEIRQALPTLTVRFFEEIRVSKVSLAGALFGEAIGSSLLPPNLIAAKNTAASRRATSVMRCMNRMAERAAKSHARPVKDFMRRAFFKQIEWLVRGEKLSLPANLREKLEAQYEADKASLSDFL